VSVTYLEAYASLDHTNQHLCIICVSTFPHLLLPWLVITQSPTSYQCCNIRQQHPGSVFLPFLVAFLVYMLMWVD